MLNFQNHLLLGIEANFNEFVSLFTFSYARLLYIICTTYLLPRVSVRERNETSEPQGLLIHLAKVSFFSKLRLEQLGSNIRRPVSQG